MRFFIFAFLVIFASGCTRQKPLVEGRPVSGKISEFPIERAGSNSFMPIDKESYVTVYSTLIVVESPKGIRQVVPLNQVSDLKLK